MMRKKMVKCAKEGIKLDASNSQIFSRMHDVFVEMEPQSDVCTLTLLESAILKYHSLFTVKLY